MRLLVLLTGDDQRLVLWWVPKGVTIIWYRKRDAQETSSMPSLQKKLRPKPRPGGALMHETCNKSANGLYTSTPSSATGPRWDMAIDRALSIGCHQLANFRRLNATAQAFHLSN